MTAITILITAAALAFGTMLYAQDVVKDLKKGADKTADASKDAGKDVVAP